LVTSDRQAGRQRSRQKDTDKTDTNRQTCRHADRHYCGQTGMAGRQTGLTGRWTGATGTRGRADRQAQTGSQQEISGQSCRQIGRQAYRQVARQTDRQTDITGRHFATAPIKFQSQVIIRNLVKYYTPLSGCLLCE
jgi:hypothetical protein